MRLRLTTVVATIFVAFALLISVQSQAASNDGGKISTYVIAGSTVGSTKLAEGDYDVKVDGSNVTFSLNSTGKVVAQAPVQWKDESAKAQSSTLDYDGNKIVAIHFRGKTRFASISE